MSTQIEKKYKECKHCGEEVLYQAIRCKHCQGNLKPGKSSKVFQGLKSLIGSITKSRKSAALSIIISISSILFLYFGYIGISRAVIYINTDFHVDRLGYIWQDGTLFRHEEVKFKLPEGSYFDSNSNAYVFEFNYPDQTKKPFSVMFRIIDKNIDSMYMASKITYENAIPGGIYETGFGKNKYKSFNIFHRSGHLRYYQPVNYPFTIEVVITPFLGEDGAFIVNKRILSSIKVD
jgi:hypothetical protein